MIMTGGESYLLDAGWLFFAGWSLMVVTVSVIAFAKDFLALPWLFERYRRRPVSTPHSSIGRTRV
jgi:hypothetical protein